MSSGGHQQVPVYPQQDMSGFEDILAGNAEMAAAQFAEGLAFQKEQWEEQKAMQREVMDVQIPIMKNQLKWSEADRERYETVFLPLQDEMIADAKDWASPERQELEAGKAQSEVTKAFENQRQNSLRKLEAMGIDKSQTRSLALDRQIRAQGAAAQAAAGNNARRYTEERGNQMKAAVSGFGNALPSQALGASQAAVNTGSRVLADRNAMIGANVGIGTAATGALNASTNAASSGGQLVNSGYQNQLAGWQAQQQANQASSDSLMSGLGTIAGIATMFADGGQVHAEDGQVSGPGGPKGDAIPARLSDNEYVVPAEVVQFKGTEFFDKLVNKSRETLGIPPEEITMQGGNPQQGIPQEGQ